MKRLSAMRWCLTFLLLHQRIPYDQWYNSVVLFPQVLISDVLMDPPTLSRHWTQRTEKERRKLI